MRQRGVNGRTYLTQFSNFDENRVRHVIGNDGWLLSLLISLFGIDVVVDRRELIIAQTQVAKGCHNGLLLVCILSSSRGSGCCPCLNTNLNSGSVRRYLDLTSPSNCDLRDFCIWRPTVLGLYRYWRHYQPKGQQFSDLHMRSQE